MSYKHPQCSRNLKFSPKNHSISKICHNPILVATSEKAGEKLQKNSDPDQPLLLMDGKLHFLKDYTQNAKILSVNHLVLKEPPLFQAHAQNKGLAQRKAGLPKPKSKMHRKHQNFSSSLPSAIKGHPSFSKKSNASKVINKAKSTKRVKIAKEAIQESLLVVSRPEIMNQILSSSSSHAQPHPTCNVGTNINFSNVIHSIKDIRQHLKYLSFADIFEISTFQITLADIIKFLSEYSAISNKHPNTQSESWAKMRNSSSGMSVIVCTRADGKLAGYMTVVHHAKPAVQSVAQIAPNTAFVENVSEKEQKALDFAHNSSHSENQDGDQLNRPDPCQSKAPVKSKVLSHPQHCMCNCFVLNYKKQGCSKADYIAEIDCTCKTECVKSINAVHWDNFFYNLVPLIIPDNAIILFSKEAIHPNFSVQHLKSKTFFFSRSAQEYPLHRIIKLIKTSLIKKIVATQNWTIGAVETNFLLQLTMIANRLPMEWENFCRNNNLDKILSCGQNAFSQTKRQEAIECPQETYSHQNQPQPSSIHQVTITLPAENPLCQVQTSAEIQIAPQSVSTSTETYKPQPTYNENCDISLSSFEHETQDLARNDAIYHASLVASSPAILDSNRFPKYVHEPNNFPYSPQNPLHPHGNGCGPTQTDFVQIALPYGMQPINKSRLKRKKLNDFQQLRLNNAFKVNRHPSKEECELLARELQIPIKKIKIWFNNNRSKVRKEEVIKSFST